VRAFERPMVRGEEVAIIRQDERPQEGVLGATVGDVLVRYPDGEQGYVSESDITEGGG
jgi:hypothetical protein